MAGEHVSGRKREWLLPQLRPLTLLIGCGAVLGVALLVVTGLVAGYLRQQTLESTKAGLSRLSAVLVEAGNRSLLGADTVLGDVASHVRLIDTKYPDALAHDLAEAASATHLDRVLEAAPQIAGLALVTANGSVVSRTGAWPEGNDNVALRDYFLALRDNTALEASIGAPVPLRQGRSQVIPPRA